MGGLGKVVAGLVAAVGAAAILSVVQRRLSAAPPNLRPMVRAVSAVHRGIYQASGGRIGSSFARAPVLLLTTTGRRTGQQRTTPLLYLVEGQDLVIAASNGGDDRHPAWFLNLRATPQAEVQLGGERLPVRAEIATADDKARLWTRLTEMYPSYAAYQRRTQREIPVIILRRGATP